MVSLILQPVVCLAGESGSTVQEESGLHHVKKEDKGSLADDDKQSSSAGRKREKAVVAKLMIPAHTLIPITIDNTVNSNNLSDGDMIGVTVNEDVEVDGQPVFRKGGSGVVFVERAEKAGGMGKGGRLEIHGGRLRDVYGNEYAVSLSIMSRGEAKRMSAILTTVVTVFFTLIPFGAWIDGKPATIQGGKVVDTFTTSPKEITLKP